MRLPRGESIPVRAAAGESIEVVLSRHPFTLRLDDPPVLIDDSGKVQELRTGRNVLGRHPDSDVMVDAAYRDASRTHAIIEIDADGALRITDLSSHGTFIPTQRVGAGTGT